MELHQAHLPLGAYAGSQPYSAGQTSQLTRFVPNATSTSEMGSMSLLGGFTVPMPPASELPHREAMLLYS